ncbi:MAG: C45 family autoproteolytic acyltransferase/hydrolase [Anaerolineales bacterium]
MNDALQRRIYRAAGTPYEVGYSLGRQVGPRLAHIIDRYLAEGPGLHGGYDEVRLREGALPWLEHLPRRYRKEIEGLAAGSGVSLQRLAEWCYVEECGGGCSAFLFRRGEHVWVGRNNDLWAPDLWNSAAIKEVTGRLPTLTFGMAGEPFTGTGVNGARLWLHYNYLPAYDGPNDPAALPPFVLLVDMLETCRTLAEVEARLERTQRTGAMLLFAVEGARDAGALFECTCTAHARLDLTGRWLAGTNHYLTPLGPAGDDGDSRARYARLTERLGMLGEIVETPRDFISILADPRVEGRGETRGTVYANVACPATGEQWTTLGGYPAASAGHWQRLNWPPHSEKE